jgi:hypothetical protein
MKKNRAERASGAGTSTAAGGSAGASGSGARIPAPVSARQTSASRPGASIAIKVVGANVRPIPRAPPPPAAPAAPRTMVAPTMSAGPDSPDSPPRYFDSDGDGNESDECNCPNCRRRRAIMMGMDVDDYDSDGMDMDMAGYMFGFNGRSRYQPRQPEAPRACNLKEMPDPLLDPTMIELAHLTFEVEALGDNTIASIAGRLVPHGFYRPTADNVMSEMGEKLTLGRMITSSYSGGRQLRPVIKLTPTHITPKPTPPAPTRVIPITVHFWDGRALPTVYGVTITPGIKMEQVMETLRGMLNLDATIDIHPQWVGDSNTSISMQTRLADEWLFERVFVGNKCVIEAFCIPKPSGFATVQGRPVAAVLKFLPTQPYESPLQHQTNTKSMKLVLPIGIGHENGGSLAKAAVARSAVAALQQYRLTPDDADETTRLSGSLRISWGFVNAYSSSRFEEPPDAYMAATRYRRSLSGDNIAVGLKASFTAEDMEASFKSEIWDILPIVDPSAASSLVLPTIEYLKALKSVRSINAEEREMPDSVLRELDAASEMKDISTIPVVVTPGSPSVGPSALVRYKAELTPLVEETGKGRTKKKVPAEKKGILKVRVFVFRTASRNRIGFFDQGSEWTAAAERAERQHRTERNVTPHRLKFTLWYHLQQNPHFTAFEKHHRHWAAKDSELSSRRSITSLMEAMERPEAATAVQPRGLTVTLRPYQLQSLKFMWDEERGQGGFRRHVWVPAAAVDGTPFWYSPLLGRVASVVPEQPSGGWCCEEMGLGKTIEVLALVLANPADAVPAPGTLLPNQKLRSRATLVVCAVSLVGQWIAEAQEKTAGSLKIHMYHGQGRIKDARRLATEFDLIVTTYATLSSDCGNKNARGGKAPAVPGKKDAFNTKNSPLHGVEWHRLVLDESHTCKNPAVGHTKACVALSAQRRWMCTGTPINTDVGDLYGQFAVLGFAPFNNKSFFDANIKNAFGNNVYGGGCPELLHALGAIMVRHTKRQELGGEQVLQLPPKTEELVPGKQFKKLFSSCSS